MKKKHGSDHVNISMENNSVQNNTEHINTNWTSLFIFMFDMYTNTYNKKIAFRKIIPQVKVFETFGGHDNAKSTIGW